MLLLDHLLATPLPHPGLATKCLLHCQQQRRCHSGVHGRAAGRECRPPLQPDPFHPSFGRMPHGGRSPPQAPMGERGGKMRDVPLGTAASTPCRSGQALTFAKQASGGQYRAFLRPQFLRSCLILGFNKINT